MKLFNQDNIESLKTLKDNSVDSCVTDGPYGLEFMGKKWDYDVPSREFWEQVYRVLKPGGHVLSFGGTRCYHRMVVNLEDAGFEIRDCISWLYASGFPKSLNIGKAVDKINGNKREIIGKLENYQDKRGNGDHLMISSSGVTPKDREPIIHSKGTSPQEGQGTSLKPAQELICMARKPISENTITENVLKWGTGGINVDGCRIECGTEHFRSISTERDKQSYLNSDKLIPTNSKLGRFPANIILDESAAEELDKQSGISKTTANNSTLPEGGTYAGGGEGLKKTNRTVRGHNDSGGSSRFFYIAKVSKKERNM